MTKVTIDRELLELVVGEGSGASLNAMRELRAILAAPRQPEGDAHKHEAQPEVAQNTGSRSMTNKLSSQGCTGCTGVEGVAAPCETPDAVDIFAWATFDGEGSHDLRLYEDNEGYLDDFRDANPLLHPDWVFPLCRLSDAQRAIAELTDRNTKLCATINRMVAEGVLICDERDTLRQQLAERDATIERLEAGIPRIQEQSHQMRKLRDKLEGLLLDLWEYTHDPELEQRIEAALAEVKP